VAGAVWYRLPGIQYSVSPTGEGKSFMANERSEKMKAIEAAIGNLEKQYGKGTIMRLGDHKVDDIAAISTNSIGVDAAIGVGGVPRGRIIEVYGPESSGKTTLALHVVAEAQKQGGIAAYIDAEHALDAIYAEKLGVNINDLFVSQPDSGEQALEICESLVRSGAVDVVVVDSVAALTPKAELDGDMGDSLPGLQARLMSQALRKLTAVVARSNTTLIFINQIREKIGVMFGSPETTTGGRALKFYSSVRLDIRRIGQIKDGENVVGNRTKVKVVKNKVAPPFREAEFDIMYGEGISRLGEIIDIGVENKIIDKSGAWFSYKGERLGQGRDNSKNTLRDNPELLAKVEGDIRAALGIAPKAQPATAGNGGAAPAAASGKRGSNAE
jgi:recombination protein RecA